MHLKTLALKNFRNLKNEKFQFNPEFNFIFGKNAQGKTNIIEAIYYLSELKSFRTSNRHDLISSGAEFGKLEAGFVKEELSWEIDITLSQTERKVLLNNKKPSSRRDYYELIPVILFEPRHIYLFRDSPSQRRKYLNRAHYIQDVGFLTLMRDYEKVVAQKNKVLKEGFDLSLVDVWNEKLIELGSQIIFQRLKWFDAVGETLAKEYEALSQSKEKLRLVYKPAQDLFGGERGAIDKERVGFDKERVDAIDPYALDEIFDKTFKSAIVEKIVLLLGALVRDINVHTLVEKGKLSESLRQGIKVVFCEFENLSIRFKPDFCPLLIGYPNFFKNFYRITAHKTLLVHFALALNFHL